MTLQSGDDSNRTLLHKKLCCFILVLLNRYIIVIPTQLDSLYTIICKLIVNKMVGSILICSARDLDDGLRPGGLGLGVERVHAPCEDEHHPEVQRAQIDDEPEAQQRVAAEKPARQQRPGCRDTSCYT